MALVLDLRGVPQLVRLTSAEPAKRTVGPPSLADELRLRQQYRHPWSTTPSAFVDESFAYCVSPPLSRHEARSLSPFDRTRLRSAVATACGCAREWRRLHGSHLSLDERLFAVMYWRWQDRFAEAERLHAQYRGHIVGPGLSVALSGRKPLDLPATLATLRAFRPSPALEAALNGPPLKFTLGPSASRTPLDALKALGVISAGSVGPAARFQLPLSTILRDLNASKLMVESVVARNQFSGLRDLSAVTGTGPFPPVVGLMTSVSSGLLGMPGRTSRYGAWPPPLGLPGMVGRFDPGFKLARALVQLMLNKRVAPSLWALQLGQAITSVATFQRLTESMRELGEAVEVVESFESRWQSDALYFILSAFLAVCSLWEMRDLATLSRAGVEAAVLLAVEAVVTDRKFMTALRKQVEHVPGLTEYQRVSLDHALEHAIERQYMKACPSLYVGLEGAFWHAGIAGAVVTLERRDIRNTNKELAFESMVRRLDVQAGFKTFVIRSIYSTTGNPYRHGGVAENPRRQVLLGVVALAGWFEEFLGVPVLTELLGRMAAGLPLAVERVLSLPQQLSP